MIRKDTRQGVFGQKQYVSGTNILMTGTGVLKTNEEGTRWRDPKDKKKLLQ